MSWQNISLIAGIFSAIAIALVALYRANSQKGVDVHTIEQMADAHDNRRTTRLYLLELYYDRSVDYTRASRDYIAGQRAIIGCAQAAGFLPETSELPPNLRAVMVSAPPKPPDPLPPVVKES